jgi:hypothetical protein
LQEFEEGSTCNLRLFWSHRKQGDQWFPFLEHHIIEVIIAKADVLILLNKDSKPLQDL